MFTIVHHLKVIHIIHSILSECALIRNRNVLSFCHASRPDAACSRCANGLAPYSHASMRYMYIQAR